ncbi:MAG: hypothetical protein ACE5JS_13470 [Nitrospinota bacterium]
MTGLVGMKQPACIEEALAVAAVSPASSEDYPYAGRPDPIPL